MIDPKLNLICKSIDEWCQDSNILYDIVCDEADMQGVLLFNNDKEKINNLLGLIHNLTLEYDINVETSQIRNGIVVIMSLKAITESIISSINDKCCKRGPGAMTFRNKIESVFDSKCGYSRPSPSSGTNSSTTSSTQPVDFHKDAIIIVREAQRKSASSGMDRGKKTDDMVHNLSHKKASKKRNLGESFDAALTETLDGLATSDGQQPMDLFKTFARALRVLGNRLGIGPLQQKLKEKGIKWKKSADGQDLILTISNSATNSEQPVARINYETLQNPSDFQDQLKNMLDFAMGQAPGAFAQQEKQIADRKKTISDISKAIKPMDQESEVAKQMNAGIEPEKMAATTAALPKPL